MNVRGNSMNAFEGRPDLLLLFIAQIAFIIIQIVIYLRVSRAEKKSRREQSVQRVEKTGAGKKSTAKAKRKLNRAKR